MELLTDPQIWIALVTLASLEIVLGIDNIVFISIMAAKLPEEQRQRARITGLAAAMIMRILLLLSIAVIIGLTAPLFSLFGHEFSGRDLILIGGGLFLLAKATLEIHARLEDVEEEKHRVAPKVASFAGVIVQIMLLDIVFSLDSVITAVGMVDEVPVMVAAIIIAVLVMMVSAGPISEFVERNPSIKMLALAFLLLIGTALVAEGFELHIPKGYIYFAMGFSVFVELLNLRSRGRRRRQIHLNQPYYNEEAAEKVVREEQAAPG
ncbi:MAG: TerC family protein [Chloroflexota bacterium]|nr:TerC family protein [Chloroflexota bacterium]